MIPGLKVFFQGALFAIFLIVCVAAVARSEWTVAVIAGVICFAAMWFGLDNGFRLHRLEPRP